MKQRGKIRFHFMIAVALGLISKFSVRRSDLRSSSSSPDSALSDGEAAIRWRRQQLDQVYEVEVTEPVYAAIDEPAEDAYDFRLFSASKSKNDDGSTATPLLKIILRSPEPEGGESGFVRPRRLEGYYFTGARSREEQERYSDVAIEGDNVVKQSQSIQPGYELPWRVTTIKVNSRKRVLEAATQPESGDSGKRKRMGKKRRIAIRVKLQAHRKKEESTKRMKAEKEVLERERRSRRNREKKIKRREKARALKKEPDDGTVTAPDGADRPTAAIDWSLD
ncbi:MAG: hypothetical protein LQ350_003899 [Teloschistes chrysophthalmus]|nr:MAG: hypothetical protein LQ350_003899 [Niorma chrysophthalma]